MQSSDDLHLAAEAVTDSMDGQADDASDIRIEKWYLPPSASGNRGIKRKADDPNITVSDSIISP